MRRQGHRALDDRAEGPGRTQQRQRPAANRQRFLTEQGYAYPILDADDVLAVADAG